MDGNGVRGFGRFLSFLALPMLLLSAGCGGGGQTAGGGTGGTGISTGAVTAFGSVHVNGVTFTTDNAIKIVNGDDNSPLPDNVALRIGMVVAVRHKPGDNAAMRIDYDGHLKGPVAGIAFGEDNTVTVLGHAIVVDGATRFEPPELAFADLSDNNVVEVSGFADGSGRVRATYIARDKLAPDPGDLFRIRGFVMNPDPVNSRFGIGPLPGLTVVTVVHAGIGIGGLPPGGLTNGLFLDVRTTDLAPAGAIVTATRIDVKISPYGAAENDEVSFEGYPTGINPVQETFTLNGVTVAAAGAAYTDEGVGTRTGFGDITASAKLQVEGTMSGGVLPAAKITFK